MGGGSPRGTASVLVALALVATSTAAAARIVGTDRAEVLRGTPGPDRILGGKGNDRLVGLGGDDELSGGPGFDRFSCGAGRDVVHAEPDEPVAADCEVVRRSAPPERTPPARPLPASTPAPGTYCGYTQLGPGLCLDTDATGKAVARLATGAITDCSGGVRLTVTFGLQGDRAAIEPDLSFSYAYSGPLAGGSSGVTGLEATYTISGRFTTSGTASGLVSLGGLSFVYDGRPYACADIETTWTAERG